MRVPACVVAAVAAASVLLAGCSGGKSDEPDEAVREFRAELASVEVVVKDANPTEMALASQRIALLLQQSGVQVFSFDTSEPGRLLVRIGQPITADAREALVKKIEQSNEKWDADAKAVAGLRFRLVGPLPGGADGPPSGPKAGPAPTGRPDRLPAAVGKAIADALGPVLPGGYQIAVEDGARVVITFSGELDGGSATVERARRALAEALGAPESKVVAEKA